MKYLPVLRFVAVFILLSLLVVAIPAAPVKAAASITLSPEEGGIGDTITVTGSGFNKSTATTDKYAAIFFSSDEATTLDDIDVEVTRYELVKEGVWLDQDGEFETTFKVPQRLNDGDDDEDVEGGTYFVYVCHYMGTIDSPTISPRVRAIATFTVNMGEIVLSAYRSLAGDLVEIEGTDFAADKDITIKYDEYIVHIEGGDRKTGSDGSFGSVILVPDSVTGAHTITAVVAGSQAEAQIYIDPAVVVSPVSGEAGTAVMVKGTGFGALKTVTVWFQGVKIVTARTNALGNSSASFHVPQFSAGLYTVDVDDGVTAARTSFTIVAPAPPPAPTPLPAPPAPAAVSMSATTGSIGQGIVMGGSGFKASSVVTVKYDDEVLTTATTDSEGVFVAAFTVPRSKFGVHNLTVSDGTNIEEFSFTVESKAPPIPTLLKPEDRAKLKAPIFFDWSDVSDSSLPVTYVLQVATAEDFSASSIVLEKRGLATSEYSVTSEESVNLVGVEEPYYWRVKSIDGAQNESSWTYAGTFYVVTPFPRWALYTLLVLGALLFSAIGYFIHARVSLAKG